MKKLIPLFILLLALTGYAQTDSLDKMELKDGTLLMGKVEKIKTDVVEFKENETGLIYENNKADIRYIQLSSGKVLTFEDYQNPDNNTTQNTQQPPVVIEKDDGPSTGLIILATVGVVLIVLLIIGAAAQ